MPLSILSKDKIIFIRVVFPCPDGPINPTISPGSIERFKSFNMGLFLSYENETLLKLMLKSFLL